MTDYQTLLDQCHRPFKWYEHEFNPQGHIYVKIQNTVQRLNSLGVPWNLIQGTPTMSLNGKKTSSGKDQYDVIVAVQLEIEGLGSRGASGGDTNFDPDNAVKSAGSYALRKAGSLFGISHYLMLKPHENTALVKHLGNADLGDVAVLKKAIKIIAEMDNKTPADWLNERGVIKEKFNDVSVLTAILQVEGRI